MEGARGGLWANRRPSEPSRERRKSLPLSPVLAKPRQSAIKLHWRDVRTTVTSAGLLKPRLHAQGFMPTSYGCGDRCHRHLY